MTPQNQTAGGEPPATNSVPEEEAEPPRSCIDITVEDERWETVDGLLDLAPKLVADALTEAGLSPHTHAVSIALLSDREVRALNKLFRNQDKPTNVLSFPAQASAAHPVEDGPVFLGDIALAYETAMAEAGSEEKPALNHAAHLIVHGVLHLAGFDHESDRDAERMEAAERTILARFGIPDPYRDDSFPLNS